MTLRISILAVALAAAFAQGCPPDPKPPPNPDGGDAAPPADASVPDAAPPTDAGPASVYDLACVALKVAGCSEGNPANCASAMKKNQEGRISDYHPRELGACSTKSCVRSASKGTVACP